MIKIIKMIKMIKMIYLNNKFKYIINSYINGF